MPIAVGSGNPLKRAAVESVVDAEVVAESVDSGVSEQPRGRAETVAGAETRAERALAAGGYDLGVGLEGGVAAVDGAPGLYLVMWAAATDGEIVGRGAGPSLRLPAAIADRVDDGEELGPVMDDVLGESEVKKRQGAAGALTDGRVDRTEALATAAAAALGPFATDLYEH
ncbi:MAG: DUF84 family protein [Halolamina sp.]